MQLSSPAINNPTSTSTNVFSNIKEKLLVNTALKNLVDVRLSERSHTPKSKYCVIPFMRNSAGR